MRLFDRVFGVAEEDIEFHLRFAGRTPWAELLLNPRRLRGSDFLMRWSQGVWSEHRVLEALERTGRYWGLPYGPSGTAPAGVREVEMYFERLAAAGLGSVKRPDILVFATAERSDVPRIVESLGGVAELPFQAEDSGEMQEVLRRAVVALECENSLWRARRMPDYDRPLRPMRRLKGRPGLPKNAVVPTVIVKEEDRGPLRRWQTDHGLPIHLWHLFYDQAFGLSFDEFERLLADGLVEATRQVFQAPGGATTRKVIYKVCYRYAYTVGGTDQEPELRADSVEDPNGHILPYVRFVGGRLALSPEALHVLDAAARRFRQA